jgi:ribosomal protein S18 acetylase RimI-like enzyme
MQLLRRILHIKQAALRLADTTDITGISKLLRDGARRYYGLSYEELPALLGAAPAVVLEAGNELWGTAFAGWSLEETTWLRGLAITRGLELEEAVKILLPALHDELRARGLRSIFYAGDETTDRWLIPLLHTHGYVSETNVVVYEKHNLSIPSQGNPHIRIRPCVLDDLDTVRALDRICFEPHWRKDDMILHSAIIGGPLFILAEQASEVMGYEVVGYAYATTHFHGRLAHLVRIAVAPEQRGKAIGVRVLAEVIAYARSQGSYVITLNTQSYNVRAQQLYTWFGFKLSGESQMVLRCDL